MSTVLNIDNSTRNNDTKLIWLNEHLLYGIYWDGTRLQDGYATNARASRPLKHLIRRVVYNVYLTNEIVDLEFSRNQLIFKSDLNQVLYASSITVEKWTKVECNDLFSFCLPLKMIIIYLPLVSLDVIVYGIGIHHIIICINKNA